MDDFGKRRGSDDIISRVEQKLDDHIERFERFEAEISSWRNEHMQWANAEREKLEKRTAFMESLWHGIEKPIKWVGWTITVFMTIIVTRFATEFVDWLRRRWHP